MKKKCKYMLREKKFGRVGVVDALNAKPTKKKS